MKLKVEDLDLIRGESIEIEQIEIVTDDSFDDRVEIYILDSHGERIEGGTFSRAAFMSVVKDFYNRNY